MQEPEDPEVKQVESDRETHGWCVCESSLLALKHVYSFVNDSSVIHKNVVDVI